MVAAVALCALMLCAPVHEIKAASPRGGSQLSDSALRWDSGLGGEMASTRRSVAMSYGPTEIAEVPFRQLDLLSESSFGFERQGGPLVAAGTGEGGAGGSRNGVSGVTGSAGETCAFSLPNGVEMEFVWIEPGTFVMGSPSSESGRNSDEGPQHEVTITEGFWLGKYEITQGQWEGVMGTTPWSGQSYVQSNPSHPAVYIPWNDLAGSGGLIEQLNAHEGSALYRLPSEAEWEYACRAGTSTRWSFGDEAGDLGDYAWYRDNAWNVGLKYAQPVGAKLGNPWGLYDMHGNVWEWVQDRWGSHSSGTQMDPQGPSSGSNRVFRGGVFDNCAQYTRSAIRGYDSPGFRDYYIGARLLRTR